MADIPTIPNTLSDVIFEEETTSEISNTKINKIIITNIKLIFITSILVCYIISYSILKKLKKLIFKIY